MLPIKLIKNFSAPSSHSSFEQPLELLLSCHEKIIHFSSALYEIIITLQQEGWNDQLMTSADQVCHYFNIAGPEHHLDEEMHLFPGIIALDPTLKKAHSMEMLNLINTLIKDHVETDLLWKTLDNMLAERSEDFSSLEQLAAQFQADIQQHVSIENEQIFPFAKQHISHNNLKKIGLSIAKRRGIHS